MPGSIIKRMRAEALEQVITSHNHIAVVVLSRYTRHLETVLCAVDPDACRPEVAESIRMLRQLRDGERIGEKKGGPTA